MHRRAVSMFRLLIACSLAALFGERPAAAGPIVPGVWYEFAFTDAGVSPTGCLPADPAGPFCIASSGAPTTFADAPDWTFFAAAPATLIVTDAFVSTDQFEILDDFGGVLGMTSLPAADVDCGDDPEVCLATPGMSTGIFALAAGPHSFTIVPLQSGGGGFGVLPDFQRSARARQPAAAGNRRRCHRDTSPARLPLGRSCDQSMQRRPRFARAAVGPRLQSGHRSAALKCGPTARVKSRCPCNEPALKRRSPALAVFPQVKTAVGPDFSRAIVRPH